MIVIGVVGLAVGIGMIADLGAGIGWEIGWEIGWIGGLRGIGSRLVQIRRTTGVQTGRRRCLMTVTVGIAAVGSETAETAGIAGTAGTAGLGGPRVVRMRRTGGGVHLRRWGVGLTSSSASVRG